jgi:hydroxymethylglutaryl-CoA reductase
LLRNTFPPSEAIALLKNYWNTDEKIQKLHDEFIENTITNFYIPLGVALILIGKYSTIPMAIEEIRCCRLLSLQTIGLRGGFKATVINTEKIGQYIFFIKVMLKLGCFFVQNKASFSDTESITKNMQKEWRNSGHCLK